jgi:hypothetical protein
VAQVTDLALLSLLSGTPEGIVSWPGLGPGEALDNGRADWAAISAETAYNASDADVSNL